MLPWRRIFLSFVRGRMAGERTGPPRLGRELEARGEFCVPYRQPRTLPQTQRTLPLPNHLLPLSGHWYSTAPAKLRGRRQSPAPPEIRLRRHVGEVPAHHPCHPHTSNNGPLLTPPHTHIHDAYRTPFYTPFYTQDTDTHTGSAVNSKLRSQIRGQGRVLTDARTGIDVHRSNAGAAGTCRVPLRIHVPLPVRRSSCPGTCPLLNIPRTPSATRLVVSVP
ncbi:hypothetical protein C2E23DRAFT_342249 [Lenzites betulinus]|nr:hypothetical protein C2E23DRAFT_342249 [Lenzites betulinus]